VIYTVRYYFGWRVVNVETMRYSERTLSRCKAWRLAGYLNRRLGA